ncbi:Lipoprotein LipO precursor [Paenibacillus konkukensis]|uniref:Lipoprotein LipO n=1 Tax=Paenibacillus konkukensis TaxID=2020716 RepID=A0ABY4RDR6_9BACL|nr:extracellular solute-binding protein [Paenibacillus konkukensis]UQZ80934.1 Lipoprotein LipO precursor [Paenibacillus konkukensis]
MKTWTPLLLAGALAAGAAGCSQGNSASGDAPSGSKEPLTINMMTTSYAGGGWPEDHPIIKEIDKKLNINLKVQWVPSDTYSQKLNVMAASNDFPDVFYVPEAEFNKWRDKGVFMDVKPELGNYANLTKYIPADAMAKMNPKDKYYGFPYYVTDTRDTLAIRKDWLDKLGLKMPTTTDEFYEVAKAFATKDPDGNGQADTPGFSFGIVNNKFSQIEPIMGAFGLGNDWAEINGQLVPMQVQTEELKQFAAFMQKAYAEGVMDKDFPANKLKDSVAKLEAGKTGIAMIVTNEFFNGTLPTLKKLTPSAELVQLLPPKGPSGKQTSQTLQMTNKIVINAKIDAAKKQRILQMLDYMLSDEGYDLIKNGIEGVHYTKSGDGKFQKLEAFDKDRPQLLSTWFFRRFDPGIQIRKWDDQEVAQKIKTIIDANEKFRWTNPAEGFFSETMTKKGANLQQKWMETMTKVIVGQAPLAAIDDAAAAWKRDGGDEIIKEINAQYQTLK